MANKLQFDRAELERAHRAHGDHDVSVCAANEGLLLRRQRPRRCDRCRVPPKRTGIVAARPVVSASPRARDPGTIACSVVWYVVLKLTDTQWGILAVVVGLVVGGAVRKGSNGRGGWRYQTLAIFLTYMAIVSSYVPYIIGGMRERSAQGTATAPADTLSPSMPAATTDSPAATSGDSKGGPIRSVTESCAARDLFAMPFLAGIENHRHSDHVFALYEA